MNGTGMSLTGPAMSSEIAPSSTSRPGLSRICENGTDKLPTKRHRPVVKLVVGQRPFPLLPARKFNGWMEKQFARRRPGAPSTR